MVREAREIVPARRPGRGAQDRRGVRPGLAVAADRAGRRQAGRLARPTRRRPASAAASATSACTPSTSPSSSAACGSSGSAPTSPASCPAGALDDDCNVLLRFEGGARGVLIASQISAGARNGLTHQGLWREGRPTWCHERHTELTVDWLDGPSQMLHAGSAYLSAPARAALAHPDRPSGRLHRGLRQPLSRLRRRHRRGPRRRRPGARASPRACAAWPSWRRAVAASRAGEGWVALEGSAA